MQNRYIVSATLCAAVLGTAVAAQAVEYPWNIPANVRVVQKTAANARTFSKIQTAINDCVAKMGATLKSTNRCVVKVGPGSWNGAVAMHSFVDVEGAGDDTVIISAAPIGVSIYGADPFTAATVKMAADSELRNVKVRNTSPTGGIGVLFDNVAGRLTSVSVEAANACAQDSTASCDLAGVIAQGVAATATLADVRARVTNSNAIDPKGDNVAVGSVRGGVLQVRDSSFSATGGSDTKAVICMDSGDGTPTNGAVDLIDVIAEVDKGTVFWNGDSSCTVTIRGSVLRVPACDLGPSSKALSANGPVTVTNSELVDCRCGFQGETVRVSGSLVDQQTGPCGYGASKIVNCWDKAFNPIANQ